MSSIRIATRVALALAATLFVSACFPPTTKTPLGSTVGFKADPALNGMWRGQHSDKDAPGYIGFVKNADDTMTAVMVSPGLGSDNGEWETFSLKLATLGGKHYMTARATFAKDKPIKPDDDDAIGDIILLYRVQGKTLALYFADEKKLAAVVKSGKLHGTVSDDTSSPDVALTSDGPELDKFFASSAAAALFEKPAVTMTKVD
jgi:hypothetical protein